MRILLTRSDLVRLGHAFLRFSVGLVDGPKTNVWLTTPKRQKQDKTTTAVGGVFVRLKGADIRGSPRAASNGRFPVYTFQVALKQTFRVSRPLVPSSVPVCFHMGLGFEFGASKCDLTYLTSKRSSHFDFQGFSISTHYPMTAECTPQTQPLTRSCNHIAVYRKSLLSPSGNRFFILYSNFIFADTVIPYLVKKSQRHDLLFFLFF